MNFSTQQNALSNIGCGWYSYTYNNYWTTCPEGDDEVRQRYFIRYVYDADDDGFVAGRL